MNDYKIKELYEQMEKELISSMKRNLKRHLKEEDNVGFKYTQWQAEKLKELSRYRRQNKSIIGEYTSGINKEVAKHIQGEVKQGSINAIKQYNKILGDKLKPSKIMNKSFFKTNDRKVNALIKAVNNDLKTANTGALRMINDQYRQVIHKSAFFVGNGVFTEQQAAKMATKELTELKMTELAIDEANKPFLSGGLNCIQYKDGRRVNIASYSQMAVRTANLRAQLMGEGDFRRSIGRVLVQATTGGRACPLCKRWEGQVFIDDVYSGGTKEDGKYMLLSEAMKQGFLHPNCRDSVDTYYPELEDIENETDEEYQADLDYINERMNYIDRNIKKYDRLALGSITTENKEYYNNKKKQWENEKQILEFSQNINYEDITKDVVLNANPNNQEISEIFKYKKYDLKNAVFDTKDIKEIDRLTLKKIQNKIGGQFNLIHRVQEKGIRTPDSEYFNKLLHKNKRYYDVKAPSKSKTIKSKKKKIARQFDEAKGQTNNIIISLLKTDCDLSNREAVYQITECLSNKRYSWIDNVILCGKNDFIKIYKKKK